MRINAKQSLYESFQSKLKESNYYYKEFSGAGEIDYIEFDDEWEAQNYAEKVNKETGHETAVYRMDNDECIAVFDAKEKTECAKPKKADLKEVFKANKHIIKEDIQGGHTIKINGKDKTIYKDYYVVLSNSDGVDFTAEEFDTEDEADDWAKRQASYNGFGAFVHETESDKGLGYYDPGDMGSDDDYDEDEESFTMYNSDYDKEVKVWKQDGKWYDEEGNRYMGYLSKQDVKSYFKGNWKELKEAIEQKYNKSNQDYNSFLKDVKRYTGSYDYLFGGKVDTECYGYPITVKYFYYNRPYVGGGYNLVANVLTPMDSLAGDDIQEAVDNAFERNSKDKLSQKEIKEKILQAVASLN